jgi:hypothetical protein
MQFEARSVSMRFLDVGCVEAGWLPGLVGVAFERRCCHLSPDPIYFIPVPSYIHHAQTVIFGRPGNQIPEVRLTAGKMQLTFDEKLFVFSL